MSEDQAGHGLRVMRGAGLVTRRTEGRRAFYRLVELTRTPAGDD